MNIELSNTRCVIAKFTPSKGITTDMIHSEAFAKRQGYKTSFSGTFEECFDKIYPNDN